MAGIKDLGVGIGWRSEIDLTVERLPGVDFVEVVAENLHIGHLPESVTLLLERGVPVLPTPCRCPWAARTRSTCTGSSTWARSPRRSARRWSATTCASCGRAASTPGT